MKPFRFVWSLIGLLFSLGTLLHAQNGFKYSYIPKQVYENQLFAVTVMGTKNAPMENLKLTFDPSSKTQPIFAQPLVVQNGSDSFYTFYFKAAQKDIQIPELLITSEESTTSIDARLIPIVALEPADDFCHVLAAEMKIKNSQVSNYDEKSHIVTLSLEAFEANLEEIKVKGVSEYGIENIKRTNAKVEGEFYAVLPLKVTSFKFSYFNTIKKQYVLLEVPVVVADASVTTQSDLNPKEDSFEKLKKYVFIFFVGFFFLLFLFKRDFFYLVFGVVSLITLLTFYTPHQKVCIKQGAPLYILPTETSTISTKIDQQITTALLGERKGYQKVEYKPGIIGWVKNEDICDR
ncbi:MAG: hypothetical protein RL113_58 [Pseudomonadota bacterium]